MNPYAIIPEDDTLKLTQLTEDQRREFRFWSRVVQEVDAAKSRNACMNALAAQYKGTPGVSVNNIRTKYYAFRREGWHALINKAKLKRSQRVRVLGDAPKGLPEQFIEYWKGIQENNQRSSNAAYRELVRRYRDGEQLPGIGTWRTVWMEKTGTPPPASCPLDFELPDSMSPRNLQRYKPTKMELAFARGGLAEARKLLPKTFSTRVGMEVGQIYVFDDMWHDHLVNAPGNSTAMRPIEFACLDLFSAMRIAYGVQPMRENPDTGKREMLRETEMRFLLAHVLCGIGYHPDGCCLHVEHGTAAIRKDLEELLFNATAGAITVRRGGIMNKPAHAGAFAPQPRGNSRFKAALESQHNLVHNELANLPAQTGKDRDHAPEELHGLMRYNTKMLAAAANLPPERAALLQLPVLSFEQFKELLNDAYCRINARTDHKLDDWVEAGLVINEYRLSLASAWEPMTNLLTMDEDVREAANRIITKNPAQMARTRLLSPVEVFALGHSKLVRLPKAFAPVIIGERSAKMIRLGDDYLFSFQDRRMGPGMFRYYSEVETDSGLMLQLEPGRFYMVHATPFDASGIFVSDESGVFLGVARQVQKPCKLDDENLHRQMGKAIAFENKYLSGFKARHTEKAVIKKQMHEHNARVLAGEPVTPEELFRAQLIEQSDVSAADLAAVTDFDRQDDAPEFSADDISNILRN